MSQEAQIETTTPKRKRSSKKAASEAQAPKKERKASAKKAPAEKKAAPEKKAPRATVKRPRESIIQGLPLNTKITFGKDKDGNDYHPKTNNPKRASAAERYARYKPGMTIQQALDKERGDMKRADINYDLRNGYIVPLSSASA